MIRLNLPLSAAIIILLIKSTLPLRGDIQVAIKSICIYMYFKSDTQQYINILRYNEFSHLLLVFGIVLSSSAYLFLIVNCILI